MARNGTRSGGRKKGTPNKKTAEQLDRIERVLQVIENEHLEEDIKSVSASQRLNLYADLVEYKMPKLTRIDQRLNVNLNLSEEPVTFE